MLTAKQYFKLLSLGFELNPPPLIEGLVGRIIRGKTYEDFDYLSNDPNRKFVFLLDSIGLTELLGKTGYDMLTTIGHHPNYIKKQISDGISYKIVVFPEVESELATWDNLAKIVIPFYPDIAEDFCKYYNELLNNEFHSYEKEAGYHFFDADYPNDFRFMSYDRYLSSKRRLWEFRAFLYHTLHIRELFTGNGYIHQKNVKEYLILNKKIGDIKDVCVGDIEVIIP